MLDCWKTNPMERPLFTDLSNCLSDVLQNIKKSVSMLFSLII